MVVTVDPMVVRLVEIQEREGWPDGRMARELSVSRPRWNLIRRGNRELPGDLAIAAARRFPELTRDLLDRVTSRPERAKDAVAS